MQGTTVNNAEQYRQLATLWERSAQSDGSFSAGGGGQSNISKSLLEALSNPEALLLMSSLANSPDQTAVPVLPPGPGGGPGPGFSDGRIRRRRENNLLALFASGLGR